MNDGRQEGPVDAFISQDGTGSVTVLAADRWLMVMLERLAHVYGRDYVSRIFDPLAPADRRVVARLMMEALALERGSVSDPLGRIRSPMR